MNMPRRQSQSLVVLITTFGIWTRIQGQPDTGPAPDLTKKPAIVLRDSKTDVFYTAGRYTTIVFSTNDVGEGKGATIRNKSLLNSRQQICECETYKGTAETASVWFNSTVLWSVCSLIGMTITIVILVMRVIVKMRRSDPRNQTPSTETSNNPHPPTRDQTDHFLHTNNSSITNTTNTNNTSTNNTTNTNNTRTNHTTNTNNTRTNNSTNTNNAMITNSTTTYVREPPPAYEDIYYLPATYPPTPSLPPPSYEDAVSKGMIQNKSN